MNHFDELVHHILQYDPFNTEVIVPTKYCVSVLKTHLKQHNCVFPSLNAFCDLKKHTYCHHYSFDWMTMGEIMAMIKIYDPSVNFVQLLKKAQALEKLFYECEGEGVAFLDIDFLKYDLSFLHHVQCFLKAIEMTSMTPWSLFFKGCVNDNKHIIFLDSGRCEGLFEQVRRDLYSYQHHTMITPHTTPNPMCHLLDTPTLYSQAQLISHIIRYEMYHGTLIGIVCFNETLRDMIIHECRRYHIEISRTKGMRLSQTEGGSFLYLLLLFFKDPSRVSIDVLLHHPLGRDSHHLNASIDQTCTMTPVDFFDYIQGILDQCHVNFPQNNNEYSMKELIDIIVKNYGCLALYFHEWCDIIVTYLNTNNCQNSHNLHMHPIHMMTSLDAALVPCDRLIVCGLNENDIPGTPSGDPWISEYIRSQIGLPTQDMFYKRQQTYFQNLLNAPVVYMTRSENDTMSRYWVQSLKKYGKGHSQTFDIPNELRKFTYQTPTTISFESRLLPKILSPSAIRLLIQNPYGFYVSYVLKIKSIVQKSLKTEQGILLHDLLKQLFDQDDVSEHMIDHLLLPIGDTYDERLFKFYAKSAMMFTIQNPYAHHRLTEWECQYPLSHGVTLKARIDRLDIFDDHIQVIDYKTGQIPTLKSMNEFKEPQMPLLSLITAHHFQKNVIPSFMVLGHMKDFKCQELHFDHDRVKDQLNELIDRFYGIDYCEIRIDHCTYDDFNHLKRLK